LTPLLFLEFCFFPNVCLRPFPVLQPSILFSLQLHTSALSSSIYVFLSFSLRGLLFLTTGALPTLGYSPPPTFPPSSLWKSSHLLGWVGLLLLTFSRPLHRNSPRGQQINLSLPHYEVPVSEHDVTLLDTTFLQQVLCLLACCCSHGRFVCGEAGPLNSSPVV